jgi:hypothetical protein
MTDNNISDNKQQWECTTCTLLNNHDILECAACGTTKEGNTENSTAMWACNSCTTYNRVGHTVCINCGLPANTNTDITYQLEGSNINDILDYLGLVMNQPASTPRQEAENIAFNSNPCRCMVCKLRAMRSIIQLNQTASTDRQRHLAGIMMNEILPELIMTTFNSDNPILQLMGSNSMNTLEQVLDRSLAEAEGRQRPANEDDIKCVCSVDLNHNTHLHEENCVICMDKLKCTEKVDCSEDEMQTDEQNVGDASASKKMKIEKEVCKLPCNHHFHKDCLLHWLEQDASCPICKARIDKKVGLKDEQVHTGGTATNSENTDELMSVLE